MIPAETTVPPRRYLAVYAARTPDGVIHTNMFPFDHDSTNLLFRTPFTLAYAVVQLACIRSGWTILSVTVREVRPKAKPANPPNLLAHAIAAYSRN